MGIFARGRGTELSRKTHDCELILSIVGYRYSMGESSKVSSERIERGIKGVRFSIYEGRKKAEGGAGYIDFEKNGALALPSLSPSHKTQLHNPYLNLHQLNPSKLGMWFPLGGARGRTKIFLLGLVMLICLLANGSGWSSGVVGCQSCHSSSRIDLADGRFGF